MRALAAAVLALGCRETISISVDPIRDASSDNATADAPPTSDIADVADASADVADGSSPCGAGYMRCGGECVDLRADSLHCGACGHACGDDPRGQPWRCVDDGREVACGGDVIELAMGQSHLCVVRRQGDVQCWGYNGDGQLGDGTTTDRARPTFVTGLGGVQVRRVASGSANTCATIAGGTVTYCWGDNTEGQLGTGAFGGDGLLRAELRVVPRVSAMGIGERHACATDGTGVWCWGSNQYGALGTGDGNSTATPVAVSAATGLSGAADLAVGREHSCAIDRASAAWCWGHDNGRLGAGTGRGTSNVPVRVRDLPGEVSQIVAGVQHTCVRRNTGASYCWGHNGFGALGDGTTEDRATATPIVDIQNLKWLYASASGGHTCAVDENGRIYCWGLNDSGQLGDGTRVNRSRPTAARIDPSLRFYRVFLGGSATCGITTTFDAVWCWGDLGAIEPTVAARGPGATVVTTPMRLTTLFPVRDGGV